MPYIFLALLGLVPAALRIAWRRQAAQVATFFVAAPLVDLADWVAYACLHLYEFQPLLTRPPVLDETLGVVLAEFIFVGTLTVLLVERTSRWVGALLGAAIVTGIQVSFTRVGLLILHGWTWWLNAAGFVVYFWLMHAYYAAAVQHGLRQGWPRLIARAGATATFASLGALVRKVVKAYVIHIGVLPTFAQNQSLGRLVLHILVLIPLGVWVLGGHWLNRTGRIIVATMGMILFGYGLVALHLVRYRAPWSPLTDGLFIGLTLGAAALVDDWIGTWADDPRQTETRPSVH